MIPEAPIAEVSRHLPRRLETEGPLSPIPVLIAGLPDGRMARPAAEGIMADPRLELLPVALSSERNHCGHTKIGDRRILTQIPRDPENSHFPDGTIAVDFTNAKFALPNAEYYERSGLSFVMGTTGGNVEAIYELVRGSERGILAVIAPNLALEVVQRQMQIEDLVANNPDIFRGSKVNIWESHRSGKKGPSGTALDFAARFERHGAEVNLLYSERDPKIQTALGIRNLEAHAYHIVTARDSRGGIILKFKTMIEGQEKYVQGLLATVPILARLRAQGHHNEVLTMTDVLREGAMVA